MVAISDYRLIGDLKIGDTFRLNSGEKLIVCERATDSCGECYFSKYTCGYDCPWFSVVGSDGRFRNILYCEKNACNMSVCYEKIENPEGTEEC